MEREPVAIVNAVTAAIQSVILAVVAFGLKLSGDQISAVMGAVIAIGAVVQTVIARNSVYSPETVANMFDSH